MLRRDMVRNVLFAAITIIAIFSPTSTASTYSQLIDIGNIFTDANGIFSNVLKYLSAYKLILLALGIILLFIRILKYINRDDDYELNLYLNLLRTKYSSYKPEVLHTGGYPWELSESKWNYGGGEKYLTASISYGQSEILGFRIVWRKQDKFINDEVQNEADIVGKYQFRCLCLVNSTWGRQERDFASRFHHPKLALYLYELRWGNLVYNKDNFATKHYEFWFSTKLKQKIVTSSLISRILNLFFLRSKIQKQKIFTPIADKSLSEKSNISVKILREYEFYSGFIRMKLSIENNMQHTITHGALKLEFDENILRLDHYEPNYNIKEGKIQVGNIDSNADKPVMLYLDPLFCSKLGIKINCEFKYKDAFDKSYTIEMATLKIPVVCPMFNTEDNINIGRLKELVNSLPANGRKMFSLSKGVEIDEAMTMCRKVIQMHDVQHVRSFKTIDSRTYEAWYYGKTKVEKIDLIIKASINKDESIEVFVAASDQKAVTGLLAEIGRHLIDRGEVLGKFAPLVNIVIKDSIIQRSNLLSSCDMNGICGRNVLIENSIVQRRNVGSGGL